MASSKIFKRPHSRHGRQVASTTLGERDTRRALKAPRRIGRRQSEMPNVTGHARSTVSQRDGTHLLRTQRALFLIDTDIRLTASVGHSGSRALTYSHSEYHDESHNLSERVIPGRRRRRCCSTRSSSSSALLYSCRPALFPPQRGTHRGRG